MQPDVDALLIVSFGGPEKPEDVMPFLENVTRGRNIPHERLLAVAGHYYRFGGRSPINDQNRALISALKDAGCTVPIYWGNRNWDPFLADTIRQMGADGVRRAAAFTTSVFGSYSGCRQYLDDIGKARAEAGPGAPDIIPLPLFYDHPGFVGPATDRLREAIGAFQSPPHVAFTAHSVPLSMAVNSPYCAQFEETCASVAANLGLTDWALVYQSRSGPPSQPWLEPDVLDHIRTLHAQGGREIVIAPIGFISDHMEVIYDLDIEAGDLCKELGMRMKRAGTVGTHPDFVRMILDLGGHARECAADCCPRPQRLAGPPTASVR